MDMSNAWGTRNITRKSSRPLTSLPTRELEQYEIKKFSFGDMASGSNRAPSIIMMNESLNTRELGLSGQHNRFTDRVAVVSLSGYDKDNPAHQRLLEELSSGKPFTLPGTDRQYIMQNIHGTGRDTVLRMVEQTAYDEVRQRHAQTARRLGFAGDNYWNNFVPENFNFNGNLQALRKHFDATGKGWSPGYDIRANLADKNIAVVDFSRMSEDVRTRFADGLAWFGSGILPQGSAQMRLGVGGKGTAHDIGYRTLGEWAEAVGWIKKGDRLILPGVYGDQDVTDMHGMQDVSQIKNLPAYSTANSNEQLNDMHTKMLRQYGLSSMTTYDDAETASRGIGSQMMMFLKLNPTIRARQAQEYKKRLAALDTEMGVREFILADPNDYLARELDAERITIADARIQRRVAAEKESLRNRALAGEWIEFGGADVGRNQKANKAAVTAVLEATVTDRATRIAKLRDMMKAKGLTRNYTDDEIAGIWGLGGVEGGALVDFTRPNAKLVGVGRSPNGYGQFVAGRNYADLARDVFKAFNIKAQGVYLSEEDMFT